MLRTDAGAAFFVLFGALALGDGQSISPAACERLAKSLSLPQATIRIAQVIGAGAFVPRGGERGAAEDAKRLPAFCRVALTIAPSPDSDIKSEVWLPTSGWNGKFLEV